MLLAVALLSLADVACSSSSGGGGATSQGGDTGAAGANAHPGCSRAVIANWTAEGKSYESDLGVYSSVGDVWLFNITSCTFPLHLIQMGNLPGPLAPGDIPLDTPIVGAKLPGHGAAEYVTNTNKDIGGGTDADHTGTLSITDVSADPPSWSADFSFTAASADGTVEVSGHIVNATYKP
jgi:hypothetical protein